MQKTKIEWCDYTINPVKGLCPMACPYCYARRMYKRFGWNPEIRFEATTFNPLIGITKPSKVFVGSTMELFGDWVKPDERSKIFSLVRYYNMHTFIFLTKQPQNLPGEFPKNCWIGVSASDQRMHNEAICALSTVRVPVKFISYEPLLQHIVVSGAYDLSEVQWAIIGQQTPPSKKTTPKKEWVDEIVDAADEAGIPVFLKENLRPVLKSVYGDNLPLRQEFPNESR